MSTSKYQGYLEHAIEILQKPTEIRKDKEILALKKTFENIEFFN